ncbi:unnamed protein product [Phyllotreta striolata]|uniref:Sm domain-containing protein n=1 Tax=Phyllotreta striolata TaxID=444603 RepID=A0A9N9TWA8_PHYSR|nr:unnamed protein product [Phyllotreta striolata]
MEDSSEKVYSKRSSRREQFHFYNSLACLVKALEGSHTLVDLRNESSVAGYVVLVDGYMNIELSDVVYLDPRGEKYYFPQFFVRHRNIRYVHIPSEHKSVDLMQNQLKGLNYFKTGNKGKRSYKEVRARRYQKETLCSLNTENKS